MSAYGLPFHLHHGQTSLSSSTNPPFRQDAHLPLLTEPLDTHPLAAASLDSAAHPRTLRHAHDSPGETRASCWPCLPCLACLEGKCRSCLWMWSELLQSSMCFQDSMPSSVRRERPYVLRPPNRYSLLLQMCCSCSSRRQLTTVQRDAALRSQLRALSIQSLGGPLPPNATGEHRGGHQPLQRHFPAIAIACWNAS